MNRLVSALTLPLRPILRLKDYPVVLHFGQLYVVTCGVLIAFAAIVSLLCATYYFSVMFPTRNAQSYWISSIATVHICSLFFSKVFHYFLLGTAFLKNPKKHLAETAFYNQGGQIGVFVGTIWLSISSGISFFSCMDLIATAGCLALALGRIGCYSYGCCHGRPTSSNFCTVYSNPESKVARIFPELLNVPLVPTQLISSIFNFSLFGFMIYMLSLGPKSGIVSAIFVITYNLFRYFIEKYRMSVVNLSDRIAAPKIFQGTAISLILSGLVYLALVLYLPLPKLGFVSFMTFGEFFVDILTQSNAIVTIITIFLIYIIFWGIHYKKLGQHFEWERS